MRFARPEEKEVAINVPESRLAELRDAQDILISVLAAPDHVYRGRIREIAPTADPATRTFGVKITVLEANGTVRLGMTATVALGDGAVAHVITLPLTALTQIEGKPAVWVFDPLTSKVNLRPVVIGAYREDGVVVREGSRARAPSSGSKPRFAAAAEGQPCAASTSPSGRSGIAAWCSTRCSRSRSPACFRTRSSGSPRTRRSPSK
jgi:multidrug efflux pump subunit AcrA (membrane-fusion protein)